MAIKKTIEQNQNKLPNSDLLLTLQKTLPQYFDATGNFKLDKFESELKENNIAEARDGYRLNFVGKDYARLQTGQTSETVIVPDSDHNNLPENINSENIFITGDNLEALRHLQNAYTGKIKMIYIDPPYNTGKEFVYNDRFEFTDDKLKTALGYGDAEIERLKSIQGKSSHSAWLTFMYPRLKLAQKLLTDDGVIFVSIDDNEQANLKLLLDDIFGEKNFIAILSIIVKTEGRRYGTFAKTHENILVYSKNDELFESIAKEIEVDGKEFSYSDELGGFNLQELRNQNARAFNSINRPNLRYPFYADLKTLDENGFMKVSVEKNENCEEVNAIEINGFLSVWRWGKQKSKQNEDTGLVARKGNDGIIRIFQKYRKLTESPKTVWFDKKYISNKGTKEVQELIGVGIFDFPKPIELIKTCLSISTSDNDIILDFFAGSSTTAHAVMKYNMEDGGNRKFIMVQWPEITNPESEARKAGYETIDQISRERIKRAALEIKTQQEEKRIENEGQLFNNDETQILDLGFKHYRLIEPEVKAIDKIFEFNPNDTKLFELDMVTPFAYPLTNTTGLDTILQTWLIQDGYEFNTYLEHLVLGNYEAHYVKQSAVLYLINSGFTHEALKDLLNKIGKYELVVNTVIVYPYSFSFEQMRGLKNNLKNNLDQNITIIERY
jgi:adenine-specific DNA-methyltransferase